MCEAIERTTPKANIFKITLTLPKLKKGTVTPVKGIIPRLPNEIIRNCTPVTTAIPKHRKNRNGCAVRNPQTIVLRNNIANSTIITKTPINPICSAILSNTISVWNAGIKCGEPSPRPCPFIPPEAKPQRPSAT